MFPEKNLSTSVDKVDIISEKLSSKIRIILPENSGKVLEERRYSLFSRRSNFFREFLEKIELDFFIGG
jgi:hypothetical protein